MLRLVWVLMLLAGAGGCAPDPPSPDVAPLPLGADISGLLPRRWLGEPVPVSGPGAAQATLVRFWTDGCPYCAGSLPALERLRQDFGPRGLATVGVYHPKPPRPVRDEEVQAAAARLGYRGPVAVDERWEALERIWLDGGERRATSASFLVDSHGRVRFVHAGPEFFASEDPRHAQADADYARLRTAVEELLAE